MKFIYSVFLLFIGIHFTLQAQTTSGNKKIKSLLPLKLGNYWVYSSTGEPDKKDTIKITKNKIAGRDTAYYFKHSLLMEKNDTIFEFQSQRMGTEKATVQYFPSVNELDYGVVVGGDSWGGRSVKKLKDPYIVNGKAYADCYEFRDKFANRTTVFSRGIGIIEMKIADQTISLIEYKIKP